MLSMLNEKEVRELYSDLSSIGQVKPATTKRKALWEPSQETIDKILGELTYRKSMKMIDVIKVTGISKSAVANALKYMSENRIINSEHIGGKGVYKRFAYSAKKA